MEYAPLGDLSRYLSGRGNKLPADQATNFLQQSLEALDFIHATGVIHRDLKPENILVVNDNQIRLADFGLALLPGDEPSVEELQSGVGTLDYLAPEVLDGTRYDLQSDLYSLGICFYEALAGAHPFQNAPLAEQRTIRLDNNVQPIEELEPSIPSHLAAVINTLVRFSADDRFSNASDALKALSDRNFRATPSQTPAPKNSESIPTPGPAASAGFQKTVTGNAAVLVEASASAAPTSAIEIHRPANTDVVATRPAQPTEKIDLERVKAIIAKDTQRKPAGAERASTGFLVDNAPDRDISTPRSLTDELTSQTQQDTSPAHTAKLSGLPGSSLWGFMNSLPTVFRSLAIASISALFTIGGLLAWHTLTNNRAAPKTVVATSINPSSAEVQPDTLPPEGSAPYSGSLTQMPEGIYTGVLKGILPGDAVPLALISRPDGEGIVLALGLEGWVPTLALTSEDADQENTLTFRANGLILRFNRELSSAQITGTVIDVVTGETGTWQVAKRS
jgi:serine/threonine protein kinase